MHIESTIEIFRPREEVFDYLAHSEFLPDYAADFVWVRQTSDGAPRLGTEYAYEMVRGSTGTFQRTMYEPFSKLAWEGPPARSGPGTMAPSGSWELSDVHGATRVNLVMSPIPRGLLRFMAPMISKRIASGLPEALKRLKQRLEHVSTGTDDGSVPTAHHS